MIDFSCKSCNANLAVDDTLAGQLVKCPHCKAVNKIPLYTGSKASLAILASTKVCLFCGQTIPADSRKCEFCGEYLAKNSNPNPLRPIYPVEANAFAGFWRRVAAKIIDLLVLTAIWVIIAAIFSVTGEALIKSGQEINLVFAKLSAMVFAQMLITILAGWLYFALMESSAAQATLGKLAIGLIVTTEKTERISFGRASLRYISRYLSMAILGIGYLMAAFTDNKQALHDMTARTLVIIKSRLAK